MVQTEDCFEIAELDANPCRQIRQSRRQSSNLNIGT